MEWTEWLSTLDDTQPAELPGATAPTVTSDPRERHKLAERERRKSMRELFLSLHALLPHANTVRKEQSAILDEIIKYIPLAAARLRALQARRDAPSQSPPAAAENGAAVVGDFGDYSIRVAQEASASVTIRVRGERVNVSLTDTKGNGQRLLPSVVLDELDQHNLGVVKSTHCRDGSKVIHHSESKICDGLERSPVLLKSRLQELACRLHKLRKSSSALKRSFDQID